MIVQSDTGSNRISPPRTLTAQTELPPVSRDRPIIAITSGVRACAAWEASGPTFTAAKARDQMPAAISWTAVLVGSVTPPSARASMRFTISSVRLDSRRSAVEG